MPIVFISLWGGDLYYYQNGEKVFIDKSKRHIDSKIVLSSILLKPKDEKALNKIKNMKNIKFIEKIGDIYKFEAKNTTEALKISAKLYEDNLTEFSAPNFLQKRENRLKLNRNLREDDFLDLPYSWHLDTIKAKEAWSISKGAGIKVAIFDNGVDYTHEDLKNNYLFGYNVNNSNDDAHPLHYEIDTDSYHGTAVAGIVGASKNNIGIIGIAPESFLIGVKRIENTSDDLIVKAFNWLKEKNIDVINCSWGTYDVSDSVKYAIVDLATNGRDGKGALIVFAVGNDYYTQDDWKDDESAIEEVIGVGAIDQYNQRSVFSNYGEKLDIVAPGGYLGENNLGISSTDIMENEGLSSGNYTLSESGELIGTSFSAPIVAGVIADILAINPNLTRDEVKDILYSTTQKTGNLEYISKDNYTFNEEYGYGLVNTKDAVDRALITNFSKNIKIGWNLIGNVNIDNLSTEYMFNNFADIIYNYIGNNGWVLNPATVKSGKGFWLRSTKNKNYIFENTGVTNSYQITDEWQTLTTDRNLRLSDSDSYYFVYRDNNWITYPEGDLKVIYKGEGYWTKKR